MSADLLALIGDAHMRRVSAKDGGEYAGPCPFCGGRDRFRVWPYRDHPGFWCRQCGCKGDPIAFLREQGLSFTEACARVGEDPRERSSRAESAESAKRVSEKEDLPPSAAWQERATRFVDHCESMLWSSDGAQALTYLRKERLLTDQTIRAWQLGYNPVDEREYRTAWGLERESEERGGNIWLPRGVVIPCRVKDELWYVKIRRPAQDTKYVHVTGSKAALFGTRTLRREGEHLPVAVMTEGEFDAMLLHQDAGDLVAAVTLGSAAGRLRLQWMWMLAGCKRILVCYDSDDAGEHGAAAIAERSERTRIARPVGATDLTEMQRRGGDLRSWVRCQLKKHGPNPQPAPAGGVPAEPRDVTAREDHMLTSIDTPPACSLDGPNVADCVKSVGEPNFVREGGRFWVKRVESSVSRRRIGEMCQQCYQIRLSSGCGCEKAS